MNIISEIQKQNGTWDNYATFLKGIRILRGAKWFLAPQTYNEASLMVSPRQANQLD